MLEELLPFINNNIVIYNKTVIPNCKPSLGVKANVLKEIAKKHADIKDYSFFSENHTYHEEEMIHAYMIGYIKDKDVAYKYLDEFVIKISNWAVCDSLVCNLKIVKKNKEMFYPLIEKYRKSTQEFEKRFAIIMLLAHYVNNDYIDKIFTIIDEMICDKYYVKMGVAWLLCDCFIKFEDKTLNYLLRCNIDSWTYNKAISKMIESYRVSDDNKKLLRSLKK